MSDRTDLLESIAETIKDYRADELCEPTPVHVERWVGQFGKAVQVPLLREMNHVLTSTYISREAFKGFWGSLVKNKNLTGPDPCAFWAKAHFLAIQEHGHSQEDMLGLFGESLKRECTVKISDCGKAGGHYIYIDDVMFSGSRVGNDLARWIAEDAPSKATVHIIVAAIHTSGEYLAGKRLNGVIADSGKKIELKYWRAMSIENRKSYKDNAEVLWPAEVPEYAAAQAYMALPHRFPLQLRAPGGKPGPFSSEQGRQLLEREFLVAGVKIRALSQNPKDILRPLGFSPFGVGFGSMIVTFRNCPNNCPLALWWGDREATSGPFHWYPLFPRKTYANENVDAPF